MLHTIIASKNVVQNNGAMYEAISFIIINLPQHYAKQALDLSKTRAAV